MCWHICVALIMCSDMCNPLCLLVLGEYVLQYVQSQCNVAVGFETEDLPQTLHGLVCAHLVANAMDLRQLHFSVSQEQEFWT